jgi:hypothetical protein
MVAPRPSQRLREAASARVYFSIAVVACWCLSSAVGRVEVRDDVLSCHKVGFLLAFSVVSLSFHSTSNLQHCSVNTAVIVLALEVAGKVTP